LYLTQDLHGVTVTSRRLCLLRLVNPPARRAPQALAPALDQADSTLPPAVAAAFAQGASNGRQVTVCVYVPEGGNPRLLQRKRESEVRPAEPLVRCNGLLDGSAKTWPRDRVASVFVTVGGELEQGAREEAAPEQTTDRLDRTKSGAVDAEKHKYRKERVQQQRVEQPLSMAAALLAKSVQDRAARTVARKLARGQRSTVVHSSLHERIVERRLAR